MKTISRLLAPMAAASIKAIDHYGLDIGTCKIDDPADFIIIDSLDNFNVMECYIDGNCVYDSKGINFRLPHAPPINTFNIQNIPEENYRNIQELFT